MATTAAAGTDEDIRQRVRAHLARQRELVAALLRQRDQLQGSLFVRYGECGKPGCVCREGHRHGPYYVLSAREKGRGSFRYLDASGARAAKEQVARYREFRKGLRALQQVNVALVALLRRYQQRQLRRASRALTSSAAARP